MIDDTLIKKRSVQIAGHGTSVSVESAFWDRLKQIAGDRRISLNQLITDIDETRTGNLSSAIRVYVLKNSRTEEAD
ncbi:MAG: ribbon-helix-helix domain-containing protein [Rhodospirillales bacterium]|jgi:predicted DNA-binding ribbon-helix-helix protein|nr:ribbon-helix-helix domain-containing protein [Rhodospirillales bacterium]MBT4039373.1 ribbon-helix-helix domain-containing protein [Rhodospirillales bacterium]MBT4627521.1 ribbon-helix-helix domain-containing protein [Rhodospirillales bacterium]MBT5352923.1 ribbon-helix-helix domain-containing protein [Rhodospirillales bacterium]MBT5520203.1 ribbon-helix-helix domain-containing protein [Rhodospirillales bacterium]